LKWAEAVSLTDAEIEDRLFPAQTIPETKQRPLPDFNYIYDQLRAYQKFNLTLAQLWLEYKAKHADGYQYSQYCEL
jgi:transposase